ncbi:selenocysteine lyase/cysteine desulfurase [Pseudokineococcus lusitanus]|uniref:Selenocysteine lyase/cysteine desulfurase n=1 Tax=Pseudokineococcus lusitanus TaxID=763993 RepID=A0A3N1GAT8_9ACTN|nr:aminotransferase class V-fold PLP-dependent enzyme [Pseudokineococcus lusitanus]ROP27331.1 selenocysteine lyase/cysteine desulfurase [Pseudokineococcus lusitanus]
MTAATHLQLVPRPTDPASRASRAVRRRRASAAARSTAPGSQPLLPVVGGDEEVPLVTGGTARYVNLDVAASAPALAWVAEHVERVLPLYASVHRGAGYASQVSTAVLEGARGTVGGFLGAREDDVVVWTRNTTDALAVLAGCVPDGGSVLALDLEHHANLLPWRTQAHRGVTARVVEAAPDVEGTVAVLERALAAEPTSLLAVTGASNVTGEELPLGRLAALAHAAGARLVVDAAQLAPHRPVDVAGDDVDWVAVSGHKLYAPFGAGALVGRRDWLDAGTPHLAGGGAVEEVGSDDVRWAAAPARHEGGTPNVLGVAALAAACEALGALGEGALEAHEAALRERLVDGLAQVPGVRVVRTLDGAASAIGVVTFTVEGLAPGLVAAVLSAEHGVGVRDGRFCAHPLLARLGLPAGAVRASVGVGSRAADVDRLLDGLRRLVAEGPAVAYTTVDGRWAPVEDTREWPSWGDPTARPAAARPCGG